jgi:hypothetical protein
VNEDEKLLAETAEIINNAATNFKGDYTEYRRQVAIDLEETLWQEYGVCETYVLWRLGLAHKGDKDSMTKFKDELNTKAGEQIQEIKVNHQFDQDVNSIVRMDMAYFAREGLPDTIKGLLNNTALMTRLHRGDDFVGLVARTGAWASQQDDVKPSESKDRQSITVTTIAINGLMTIIARDDKTGKRMDTTLSLSYFVPSTKKHGNKVKSCFIQLTEEHGEMPAAVYAACSFPLLAKIIDPQMFAACLKDLDQTVKGSDGEESSDEPTGDNNQ